MVDFLGNVLGMMVPDLRLRFESVFEMYSTERPWLLKKWFSV